TRRAVVARSNDGTCVRPRLTRAHRDKLSSVLSFSLAAGGHLGAARASGGMADAHGSGPCVRKDVGVQLPPCPHTILGNTPDRPRRGDARVRVDGVNAP